MKRILAPLALAVWTYNSTAPVADWVLWADGHVT